MTLTITMEATPENLDKIKALLGEDVKVEAPAPKAATKKEPAKKTKGTAPEPEATEEEAPTEEAPAKEKVTKTDVRAIALKLSKAGKSEELREVFSKFGAENLSGLKEEDYPEVIKALGEIDA